MDVSAKIQLVISIITLLGFVFVIYRYFRDPDERNSDDILLMKQACGFKHTAIDKQIADINGNIKLIKENHLKHIEDSMGRMDNTQTKILTILEERYQIRLDK